MQNSEAKSVAAYTQPGGRWKAAGWHAFPHKTESFVGFDGFVTKITSYGLLMGR